MPTQVRMPQLGESVTEGTIVRWLKQPGEHVELDESLAEIETEKVNAEIASPFEGTLTELLVPEGETVEVGTPIAAIQESGAPLQAAPEQPEARPAPVAPPQAATTSVADIVSRARSGAASFSATGPLAPQSTAHGMFSTTADESPAPEPQQARPVPSAPPGGNGHAPEEASNADRFSPAVLRLAREHDVDLSQLHGSGLGGRITRKDVQAFIDSRSTETTVPRAAFAAQPVAPLQSETVQEVQRAFEQPAGVPSSPSLKGGTIPGRSGQQGVAPVGLSPEAEPAASAAVESGDGDRLEPLTATRRAIARHMAQSVQTAPHAWMMVEVDVTRLVAFRDRVKDEFRAREGVDLTYLPFMIKATVAALKQYPRLNSSWSDEGIVFKRRINVGIAVNTDQGLVVPVIHDADELSVAGLAKRVADLAARARARRLRLEDIEGGTFTVDNTGPLGSVVSQPIINQPQCAIVTMEAIVKRPIVIDDAIAVRSMMNCCISFDHRIVDGGDVGPFMKLLKATLEAMDDRTPVY